jgi:hypothetical protein
VTELVEGLERDGTRYHALDFFAWHVGELRDALQHGQLGELQPLDLEQPHRASFGFRRNGTDYQIKVHKSGVAQLTRRSTGAMELPDEQLAVGGLEPAVVRSTDFPGMLLGLLIGERLWEEPDASRRILTMRFNEDENRWRAYDGPQAKWIRREVLKIDPAFAASLEAMHRCSQAASR